MLRSFVRNLSTLHNSRVEKSLDGRSIKVAWTDGRESNFHSIWLRHACLCKQCQDPSSQNRLLFPGDLTPSKVSTVLVDPSSKPSEIDITWTDGHRASFPMDWLRRHCYSKWA